MCLFKYIVHFFLLSLFISHSCIAQFNFKWDSSIPVKISGKDISNPWAGGLNAPQFHAIDLNGDSIKDLFVFDRTGNKTLTFINNGTPDSIDYTYAPKYESKFPAMQYWAVLADYNCDGKADIYTSRESSIGMVVYRNDYDTTNGLQFTKMTNLLMTEGFSGQMNLYVPITDIPAIADVDDDGDLDILTFGVIGVQVEYHENRSMENYGICDSLEYDVANFGTKCWGNFAESAFNNSINLGVSCKTGKKAFKTSNKQKLHTGSTLLALDMDDDLDKELVLGDVSYKNLIMLTNGGDLNNANMSAYDTLFPSNTVPANINIFPASFYLDIDNDGLKDLIASPNTDVASENFTGVWYYKDINSGTADSVIFNYQGNSFLQQEMIEVGSNAHPVFFDENADGLLDIIIGNYGYYDSASYKGQLSLYRNIGTASNPYFELISRDYANTLSFNLNGLYPAFGDMDNDGDDDMIIGDEDGLLHYFNNTAGAGNPANFVLTQPNYMGIDIGQFAAPQIIDVNRDTLLDLLIGEKDGNLNYYENTGTLFIPAFTLISNTFGGVDVKEQSAITGYSSPFMLKDSTGAYKLLVGSESGYIFLYDDIDSNLLGTFTMADSSVSNINTGNRASIALKDINYDGKIDLIVGNERGGVGMFSDSNSLLTTIKQQIKYFDMAIYPNPSNSDIIIDITSSSIGQGFKVEVYNILGKQVLHSQYPGSQKTIKFNLGNNPSGIYFCKLTLTESGATYVKKIMIY